MIKKRELWLTNICMKKDISIADLGVIVRAGKSINILDEKHYKISEEKIKKSLESGSLFSRRNFIKIRESAPMSFSNNIEISNDSRKYIKPLRNAAKIESESYDDLDISDMTEEEIREEEERLAKEIADLDFSERLPVIPVDSKFRE